MIAQPCASTALATPMTRTARSRLRARIARVPEPVAPAPAIDTPVRFTRTELVGLLKEYRDAEGLTPAQRAEAIAWITGHQHEPEPSVKKI